MLCRLLSYFFGRTKPQPYIRSYKGATATEVGVPENFDQKRYFLVTRSGNPSILHPAGGWVDKDVVRANPSDFLMTYQQAEETANTYNEFMGYNHTDPSNKVYGDGFFDLLLES